MSAILSFLGGAAFRMIWGEVSSFLKARQEHAQELERMRLQSTLEAERHARDQERVRLQHELGMREIQIAGDVAVQKAEAEAFVEAMKSAMKPIGIWWVDAWNGCIRPLAASIAIFLWVCALNEQGFKMTDWDREIVGVILGFYFASRELAKRGK